MLFKKSAFKQVVLSIPLLLAFLGASTGYCMTTCPDAQAVAEALNKLPRAREGKELVGIGIEIGAQKFAIEDISGVLHFPILGNDPSAWGAISLDSEFKERLLALTRAKATLRRGVCGYMQSMQAGSGKPEEVNLVFLTYHKL